MKPAAQIVWFKRDLRVNDHVPIACSGIFRRTHHTSLHRRARVLETALCVATPLALHSRLPSRLKRRFGKMGQRLIVRVGDACEVIKELHQEHRVSDLYAHEESGNLWTYQRDIAVKKLCRDEGIALTESPSNGIVRRLRSRDEWSKIRNTRMAENIRPKPKSLTKISLCRSDVLPEKERSYVWRCRDWQRAKGWSQASNR